jgi:hypothetical protein
VGSDVDTAPIWAGVTVARWLQAGLRLSPGRAGCEWGEAGRSGYAVRGSRAIMGRLRPRRGSRRRRPGSERAPRFHMVQQDDQRTSGWRSYPVLDAVAAEDDPIGVGIVDVGACAGQRPVLLVKMATSIPRSSWPSISRKCGATPSRDHRRRLGLSCPSVHIASPVTTSPPVVVELADPTGVTYSADPAVAAHPDETAMERGIRCPDTASGCLVTLAGPRELIHVV